MPVSIFQAAKRLGVSRTRVNQFIARGDLDASRDERERVCIDSDSLERLIEKRRGSSDNASDRLDQDAKRAQALHDRDERERERRQLEKAEFQRKVWEAEDRLRFNAAVLQELRETRKALTDISTTLAILAAAIATKLGVDLTKKD